MTRSHAALCSVAVHAAAAGGLACWSFTPGGPVRGAETKIAALLAVDEAAPADSGAPEQVALESFPDLPPAVEADALPAPTLMVEIAEPEAAPDATTDAGGLPVFPEKAKPATRPPVARRAAAASRPAERRVEKGPGGGGTTAGGFLRRAPLAYPQEARNRGQSGRVVLRVYVETNGRAGVMEVARSSGVASLDAAAIACARASTYQPATRERRPVAEWVEAPFRFSLGR